MPIYEFHCGSCGASFEELVKPDEVPPCPECANPEPERLLSAPGMVHRIQPTGLGAKRSEAQRRNREEGRRERLAETARKRRAGEPVTPAKNRRRGSGGGPGGSGGG